MKKVHDITVNLPEFNSYLLHFNFRVKIAASRHVTKNDRIRIFEFDKERGVITGRNLLYDISGIDFNTGLIGIGQIHEIGLIRVKD